MAGIPFKFLIYMALGQLQLLCLLPLYAERGPLQADRVKPSKNTINNPKTALLFFISSKIIELRLALPAIQ